MLDFFSTTFKSAVTVKCLIIMLIYSDYSVSKYTKIHIKLNINK